MATLKDVNLSDLVTVQVNSLTLFQSLKSIIATVNDHAVAINRLRESAFQATKSDVSWQELVHELSGQIKLLQSENKSFRERIVEMENQIEQYSIESKVRSERHHEEIQEVYTRMRMERENMSGIVGRVQVDFNSAVHNAENSFNDKMKKLQTNMDIQISDANRDVIDKLTRELAKNESVTREITLNHTNKISVLESALSSVQREWPVVSKDMQQRILSIREEVTQANQLQTEDHAYNLSRIKKIYDIMHLDIEAFSDISLPPSLFASYQQQQLIQTQQQEVQQVTPQKTEPPPPTTVIYNTIIKHKKEDAVPVSTPPRILERQRSFIQEPPKQDNDAVVKMMLNTPTFVELKRQIFLQIDQLRSDHQAYTTNADKEFYKMLKDVREHMAKMVSKQELDTTISTNPDIVEMAGMLFVELLFPCF
jgi:hypothetical protein